jgi:hypothetical protein
VAKLLTIAEDTAATTGLTLPTWFPWVLVGIGVVLLTVVIVVATASRRRDVQREAAERAKSAAEIADLKNQLVEVKRLAAAVADDLDRRAEKLERLIAEADGVLDRPPTPTPRRLGQPADSPPVDDLAQRIFMLADQGKSPVQIAQALRQPVGNVELMLALRGGR